MTYSNLMKQMLMASIDELSQTPENFAVHPDKDFTRNRKIGFHDFLLLLLTMEDDCLREELYHFFGRTDETPSKAAFYHQRAKLKDNALQELLQNYRYVCKDVPMDFISENSTEYLLSLRIVRIVIAPGIYENLITNLPDIEFDMDDLKELYHLRWAQENAYRDLKYPLCLKAFHSKKYTYIVQEVFSRAIRPNRTFCRQARFKLPMSFCYR